MVKKILLFCLMNVLVCYSLTAQKSKEKIIERLINYTWKYGATVDGKRSSDSCEIYSSYKFRKDGKVEIRSLDSSKCDNWTMIRIWKIVKLHDIRGKSYFGVRITEQEMPERHTYDDFTFEDKIFLIVSIKEGILTWVLKPPYNKPSIKDALNYLQK